MEKEKEANDGHGKFKMEKQNTFTMDNFSSTTKLADSMFPGGIGSTTTINEKKSDLEAYDPFRERNPEHPNTDTGALLHLLKGSLGTGILAMPSAFQNGGLIFGVFGTLIVGFICTHCIQVLVSSSHELCRRTKKPSMTFSETAEVAFQSGPQCLRPASGFARSFVNFALVLTYFSGNCVYVVFIAEAVHQVALNCFPDMQLSKVSFMFLLLIFLIPMNQIRQLKYLVPFSGIANVCMIASLGITVYYMFFRNDGNVHVDQIGTLSTIPLFFTTVVFAMEGIGVILPIENSLKNPQHFLGCPGILNIGMGTIIGLYTFVGFVGYLRFGDETQANIVMSLPNETLGDIAKIVIAAAVLLTYSLQFYVPMDVCWRVAQNWFPDSQKCLAQTCIRIFIVSGTVIVAAVVKNLDALIGLVGAVFLSTLGIFIPAVVETVTQFDNLGFLYWRLYKNLLLCTLSVVGMILGSYLSIQKIINGDNADS